MRTNAERAERAYRRVLNYEDESSVEECISDLLADLRHLCDKSGYDFAKRDRVAYENYLAELGEERERVRPDGPETAEGGLIGQQPH